MTAVVQMRGIVKLFPGTCANDHVDLDVQEGEILTLLGENGAGKSVLMKILYGAYQPNSGEIFVRGKRVDIRSPHDAIGLGIWLIHQQFMLVPPLTALENISAGTSGKRPLALDLKQARRQALQLSRDHGLAVDLDKPIWQASVGEQQRVEIIKALFRGAEVLIMDEPTAVLTPQETLQLFDVLRSLRKNGKTIVFISHKLEEVMAISDRITVLRAGKVVDTIPAAQATPRDLARKMVGREVLLSVKRTPQQPGPMRLEVENLEVRGDDLRMAVRGTSLQVHAGEILGIAGVDGNGQVELAEAICGLRAPVRGRVRLQGADVTRQTPEQAFCNGIAHVPADRYGSGSIADFSVRDNAVLDCYCNAPFCRGFLLDRQAITKHAQRLVKEYDVRTSSLDIPAGLLSGGNLQKLILGRHLDRRPRVLVAVHPTRGLDVGAIEFVHRQILEERQNGAAVLLVSTEQEDILSLSDRIAVMYEGRIMGVLPGDQVDIEEMGLMMAGVRRETTEVAA